MFTLSLTLTLTLTFVVHCLALRLTPHGQGSPPARRQLPSYAYPSVAPMAATLPPLPHHPLYRTSLQASVPPSAALTTPVTLWVQLAFVPLQSSDTEDRPSTSRLPVLEPEVYNEAEKGEHDGAWAVGSPGALSPQAGASVGTMAAPVPVKPHGPPTDPPTPYQLNGVIRAQGLFANLVALVCVCVCTAALLPVG